MRSSTIFSSFEFSCLCDSNDLFFGRFPLDTFGSFLADTLHLKFHIHPSSLFVDYSVLTQDEIDILNRVVKKFKDYTGAECADYMHKEKAYRDTKEEEIISFELTKELNNFDEI